MHSMHLSGVKASPWLIHFQLLRDFSLILFLSFGGVVAFGDTKQLFLCVQIKINVYEWHLYIYLNLQCRIVKAGQVLSIPFLAVFSWWELCMLYKWLFCTCGCSVSCFKMKFDMDGIEMSDKSHKNMDQSSELKKLSCYFDIPTFKNKNQLT